MNSFEFHHHDSLHDHRRPDSYVVRKSDNEVEGAGFISDRGRYLYVQYGELFLALGCLLMYCMYLFVFMYLFNGLLA